MTLAAGKLNRRFAIQKLADGQDEAGQPVQTWEPFTELWASVAGDTGLGTIRNTGSVPAAIKRYSIRVRFRRDINEGMRAVELVGGVPSGAPFDIREVRMDYAGREWTDLVVEQGANDG